MIYTPCRIEVFSSNDYPRNLVEQVMKRTPQIRMRKEKDQEKPKMLYLPYIEGERKNCERL